MGELKKWANDNSPYLRLEDGETITAEFKGYKVIPDPRDPTKEKIRYNIGGKFLDSASGFLAKFFDEIEEGTNVTLTRIGTGTATKYEAKVA